MEKTEKKDEEKKKNESSKNQKDTSLDVATKTKEQKTKVKKNKKNKQKKNENISVEEEFDVSKFDPSKILLQNDENVSLEESVAPFQLNRRRRNENAESFESYLRADNETYKPNKTYTQSSLNEPRKSRTNIVSGYEVKNDQNYDPLTRNNQDDPFYQERKQPNDPREKMFFVDQDNKKQKNVF